MENGQKTLSELFASNTFTVPIYQRAYAWEERQCEDFLRDLAEHPQGDLSKRHFLGTVLLAAKPPGDFRSRFDVVDGQQRLTTATIFAIAAIARISKDESLRSRVETFRLALLISPHYSREMCDQSQAVDIVHNYANGLFDEVFCNEISGPGVWWPGPISGGPMNYLG